MVLRQPIVVGFFWLVALLLGFLWQNKPTIHLVIEGGAYASGIFGLWCCQDYDLSQPIVIGIIAAVTFISVVVNWGGLLAKLSKGGGK